MKIKKKLIGAKVFCPILRQYFLIEEGKEEKYLSLGLDVFDKRKKPKLQKNVKIAKGNDEYNSGDVDGIDDNN